MRKLVEKAIPIIKKYEEENIKNGYGNNIYSLLNAERDEVMTHEGTIYSIFQNQYNHEIKQKLFSAFMIAMDLEEKYYYTEWDVEKEYFIGDGRIDLFFHSCDNTLAVVVELKIDAEDQENQLTRYYNFVKRSNYVDFEIVYLTLDGREPSEQSREGIPETYHICVRSFGEHIVKWLSACTDVFETHSIDSSLLKQYEILLKKITEETYRQQEIAKLFCDKDSLLAGMALVEALPEVQDEIIHNFFERLKEKIEKSESISEFYEHEIWVKVVEFWVRNTTYSVTMSIVYYDTVQYGVYYTDKNDYIIKSNTFKEKYKKINSIVEEAIEKQFRTRVRENQYDPIYYMIVRNSKNQEYDFKNFDEICADLKDDIVLEKEANYIAGQFVSYIQELRKSLVDKFEYNDVKLMNNEEN